MNKTLKTLVIIGLSFLVLDYIFIYLLQKKAWDKQITEIQNGEPPTYRPLMGIAVYLIMIFSVYFLIVSPAKTYNFSNEKILGTAALLGLAMYGVFDGTNYVLFKNYRLDTTIKDTVYGVFATMMVSLIAMKT